MSDFLSNFVPILNLLWPINLIFIIVVILSERKNTVYTIFWIFLIILFPFVGFVMYWFFGLSFRKRRRAENIYIIKFLKSVLTIDLSNSAILQKWRTLITYLEMSSKNSICLKNKIDVFFEGEDFISSVLKDIKNAEKRICMEYYIFEFDETGKRILEALAERAKNGVEVLVIVDGMNAPNLAMKRFCKENNIQLYVFFESILHSINLRANYRNHRKLTIIDSEIAYIGGMNISDDYVSKGKLGYWKDNANRVTGEVVMELEKEFYFSLGIILKKVIDYEPCSPKLDYTFSEDIEENKIYAQIVSSGPNYEFRTLRDSYLKLIQGANKRILIQTPYFVPDDSLLDALKVAIISGVKVMIMLPYISDQFIVGIAAKYYVKPMLDLGAEVYRYRKGFIHSKIMVIDDEVCTFGTGNFDNRSMYLNFEINLNVYDENISKKFADNFFEDLRECERYTIENYKDRSIIKKFLEQLFRLLSPIL